MQKGSIRQLFREEFHKIYANTTLGCLIMRLYARIGCVGFFSFGYKNPFFVNETLFNRNENRGVPKNMSPTYVIEGAYRF